MPCEPSQCYGPDISSSSAKRVLCFHDHIFISDYKSPRHEVLYLSKCVSCQEVFTHNRNTKLVVFHEMHL
jgi:hypothetical protein